VYMGNRKMDEVSDKIYKYIKYIINQKKEREEERERKYFTDYIVLRLIN
jgi:hypothetical protein